MKIETSSISCWSYRAQQYVSIFNPFIHLFYPFIIIPFLCYVTITIIYLHIVLHSLLNSHIT